ncbi:hypothetical protein GCM10009664_07790 [Kitasatospora gansuensis]
MAVVRMRTGRQVAGVLVLALAGAGLTGCMSVGGGSADTLPSNAPAGRSGTPGKAGSGAHVPGRGSSGQRVEHLGGVNSSAPAGVTEATPGAIVPGITPAPGAPVQPGRSEAPSSAPSGTATGPRPGSGGTEPGPSGHPQPSPSDASSPSPTPSAPSSPVPSGSDPGTAAPSPSSAGQ